MRIARLDAGSYTVARVSSDIRERVVRLVLISHASTMALRRARFPADEPIDEGGHRELARCAPFGSGRVVFGPELRCRTTAAELGLVGVVDPALRDLDAGGWRGRAPAEVPAGELADWLADPDFRAHGGESVGAVLDRVVRWLATVEEPTIAVTHPAVVRAAVVAALGAPPSGFWRVDVPPLGVTRLHRRGKTWTLRATGPRYPTGPS